MTDNKSNLSGDGGQFSVTASLAPIEASLREVSIGIERELKNSPLVLSPVTGHLAGANGKNIRAAIVLAVAKALGAEPKKIISLAVSIELMHLATLIHDDVIDDAPMRRGIPSVQSKFGKKLAVISGDYLFTKCFQLISDKHRNRMSEFSHSVTAICVGEALQHQFCGNPEITLKNYYKIIAGKTAALFALAMYGSAVESDADEKTAFRLARAGYYLGMVFQMVDDCLDYSGEEQKTKKALFVDLEQGFFTPPLIHAIKLSPEIRKFFGMGLTDQIKSEIINAVKRTGGVEATKADALKFYNQSKRWLNMALPTQDKTVLFNLLDAVYHREH